MAMRAIPIKSTDLLELLDQYVIDLTAVAKDIKPPKTYDPPGNVQPAEYWVSQEYLDFMQAKEKAIGYPESCWGISIGADAYGRAPAHLIQVASDLDLKLSQLLGARNCAVKMYYPEGGWMGWHHNANAPGYNILLSWTKNGNGYFEWEHPTTKEKHRESDAPGGWTCKVGYFGHFSEPDKIFWHCARAFETRITLGFIIPDKEMWESMIDDISENY
jgi:hypothetical protein